MNNKYSNFKVVWFREKLESMRTGEVTAPVYVRIKPINKCNHDCFFCVYHATTTMHDTMDLSNSLSREKFAEVVEDLHAMGVGAITLSGGGEPLLHPTVVPMMHRLLEHKIDISIITNGQLLSKDRATALAEAKWVRISMDYWDAPSFVDSRGGSEKMFHNIVENITAFRAIRKGDFSVNYIITNRNYKHIFAVAMWLKKLGIDNVRFSPVWMNNFVEYHKPIEREVLDQLEDCKALENDEFRVFSSYNITADQLVRTYCKCHYQQVVPVIAADYGVYSCHNVSYTNYGLIGSIRHQSFKDLWFSEATRQRFATFNPQQHCNGIQCANDMKNKMITEMMESYGDSFV
jgi:MoaA/NifB/PqqE/SkfB family radical SAM enzyme